MADLNITGTFKWTPNLSLTQEIAQLVKGKGQWDPGTEDFAKVAGNSVACQTFGDMLATILTQRPGTVDRVNVFTHANPGVIAFAGDIVPRTTMVDVIMTVNSSPGLLSLDPLALANLNTPGMFFQIGTNPTKYTLADVRARFTGNAALIVFYACRSGGDPKLLQDTADTLGVMVDGFRTPVAYCPRYTQTPPTIDRKHIGLQACDVFQTDNFYALLPEAASRGWVISRSPKRR